MKNEIEKEKKRAKVKQLEVNELRRKEGKDEGPKKEE